ncbi:MAG TPA: PP2C family protein-serine/threonine phosphatase [Rhodopila sp.]|jgi:sigma-B regulation protein RsbU (phosphoserine phosphatase)|nr:PP2C family protein-serine/threonine phosphatase [Rhodopila sp.]
MTEETESLRAALEERTLQLAVLLDALGERDRQDAAQREWDFALQLQTGNLPDEFPAFPDRTEFDIRGGMVTAFQVGGDVYDFYFLDDRRLAFVVADASGKGLPAAIFITRMRTILRAASRRIGDPARCLTLLNEVLCFDNPELMFVTAFYGILDTTTGEVAFANAGHNPPVHVRRDGSAAPVRHARAPILGAMEGVAYPACSLTLAPGETLCCFSDGVTEAHDPDKALFGDARLVDALARNAGAELAAMEAAVIGEVDRFIGSAPIADDLTLLLVRWNGSEAT